MSQFDVSHSLVAVIFILLLCNESCGAIKKRIVRGRHCEISNEFAVAILDQSLTIKCGGALLDDRWVVTAAQCCTSENKYVIAGTTTLTWIKLEKSVKIKITKCIQHYDYEPNGLLNNIALIQLEKSIHQSDEITYVPLPLAQLPVEVHNYYPKCSVMGWGSIIFGYAGSRSKSIRCALLDVVSTKECSKVYKGIPETIICTRSDISAACGADAGGPLVCNNVLYGVASFSGECKSDIPGVYARVDTFLAFILPHILRQASLNILNQASGVIVLACVHIALLM